VSGNTLFFLRSQIPALGDCHRHLPRYFLVFLHIFAAPARMSVCRGCCYVYEMRWKDIDVCDFSRVEEYIFQCLVIYNREFHTFKKI
jgi:hypothetical protein